MESASAVNQYITARRYLDKFLQYDIESGYPEEYAELLEQTFCAFEAVENTSVSLGETATELEAIESDSSYKGTDGSCIYRELLISTHEESFCCNPFVLTSYADEESEAVKLAADGN